MPCRGHIVLQARGEKIAILLLSEFYGVVRSYPGHGGKGEVMDSVVPEELPADGENHTITRRRDDVVREVCFFVTCLPRGKCT